MRLPSKGIAFRPGCMRGSAITFSQAVLRASLDGQTIHENTTFSSSLRCTAMGNEVTPAFDHLQGTVLLEDLRGLDGVLLVLLAVGVRHRGDKSVDIGHVSSPFLQVELELWQRRNFS